MSVPGVTRHYIERIESLRRRMVTRAGTARATMEVYPPNVRAKIQVEAETWEWAAGDLADLIAELERHRDALLSVRPGLERTDACGESVR